MSADPSMSTETAVAVILEKLHGIEEDVAEIKQQTITTNGRVTALEKWQVGVQAVKAAFSWKAPLLVGIAVAAASAVIATVLTITLT